MSLHIKHRGLYRTPGGCWVRIMYAGKRVHFSNIVTGSAWSRPMNAKTIAYLRKCVWQNAFVKGRTPDRSEWELAA